MNSRIKDIINRPPNIPVQQKEMELVVSEHIYQVNGVRVDINLEKGWSGSFASLRFHQQISKLMRAYEVSRGYFINL